MTHSNKKKKIYLIGPLSDSSIVQKALTQERPEFILYIDAGVQIKKDLSYDGPDYALGDGDGLPNLYYDHLLNRVHPREKDHSDLALALTHIQQHYDDLSHFSLQCFGLWGGRFDHHLANMGEFKKFIESTDLTEIYWYSNESEVALICTGTIAIEYHGIFSLFALEENNEVGLDGAIKYPLKQQKLSPFSSHGLSNEANGYFKVSAQGTFLVILN